MSLAVRLLLALGGVAILVTALVGFSARRVSRSEAERGFEQRLDAAVRGARGELAWEANTLTQVLVPLCRHDTFVDRTLLDLERGAGRLPQGRGIALQKLLQAQRKALRLDSLMLASKHGRILGSSAIRHVGKKSAAVRALLKRGAGKVRLDRTADDPRIVVFCTRSAKRATVSLIGTRRIRPILDRVGRAYGVELVLEEHASRLAPNSVERVIEVAELEGLRLIASVPRGPLDRALAQIDASIFLSGGIAVLLSIALAVFVARNLSLPITELAHQTRQVVRGDPTPVRGRGGREMADLARSFNQTIAELTTMRRRLAETERIAARRELAQQVAHEIKNPLAPIQAAIETLRRLRERGDDAFDEYFDEATRTVLSEVRRIKQIVTAFSEFARMPKPTFARVDFREVARGVVRLHDARETGGATVALRSEEIPPIVADRDQLVQVLTNLVQNALDATRDLGAEGRVDVVLAQNSDTSVELLVVDNGSGVASDIEPHIFEAEVSSKAEGRGFGLAIVRGIVCEHGGEITLVGNTGDDRNDNGAPGGSVFRVELPIDGPTQLARREHDEENHG
jgi:signal transduction histidine kinase